MTVTFVLETMATANATLFLHKKEDFVYSVSCLWEYAKSFIYEISVNVCKPVWNDTVNDFNNFCNKIFG